MIAAAVIAYLADQEPEPPPVRWVQHRAEAGAYMVEYLLADGRIVPVWFPAGERARYLVTYLDGGRLTVATRIDAPRGA